MFSPRAVPLSRRFGASPRGVPQGVGPRGQGRCHVSSAAAGGGARGALAPVMAVSHAAAEEISNMEDVSPTTVVSIRTLLPAVCRIAK